MKQAVRANSGSDGSAKDESGNLSCISSYPATPTYLMLSLFTHFPESGANVGANENNRWYDRSQEAGKVR